MSLPPERRVRQVNGGHMATQPKKTRPGRNGYKYREQFGVVVICEDAEHQERIYNFLKAQGLKLRVVVV